MAADGRWRAAGKNRGALAAAADALSHPRQARGPRNFLRSAAISQELPKKARVEGGKTLTFNKVPHFKIIIE